MKKRLIILLFLAASCHKEVKDLQETVAKHDPITGTRIAWDFSSKQMLVPQPGRSIGGAGYSRMISLANGDYMCVYEVDRFVECIRSTDKGASWGQPLIIAPVVDDVARAVPEIVQLSNGHIIISYNLRPNWDNNDTSKEFGIALKISTDNGLTWSDEKIVYEASYQPDNGCWEPNIIELPSGELQLYFANEKEYTSSHEQNITMLRSQDKGSTWSEGETVSFSATSRDGMPVALYLEDSQEIIVAIEDNYSNNFKPAIIRTKLSDNWAGGFVGRDANREYAVKINLNDATYQGAPYIRQLPSGNVVLSYQGTDGRGNHDLGNATLCVVVGDKEGRNFKNKTEPFQVPVGKSALWNSLSVMDGKVWAIASINAYSSGRQEVWTIAGQGINEYKLSQKSMNIDGQPDENKPYPFFVGHKSNVNARIDVSADDTGLFFVAKVEDSSVDPADGLNFTLDPQNISSTTPVSGTYAITISANEDASVKEGFNGAWKDSDIALSSMAVSDYEDGYFMEFSIDWEAIGGAPSPGSRIGFGLSLINNGNHIEDMVLCHKDRPYTWATLLR
jgi:hypothetical protein